MAERRKGNSRLVVRDGKIVTEPTTPSAEVIHQCPACGHCTCLHEGSTGAGSEAFDNCPVHGGIVPTDPTPAHRELAERIAKKAGALARECGCRCFDHPAAKPCEFCDVAETLDLSASDFTAVLAEHDSGLAEENARLTAERDDLLQKLRDGWRLVGDKSGESMQELFILDDPPLAAVPSAERVREDAEEKGVANGD